VAAAGDLRIIGIKVRSRQAAHDAWTSWTKVHVGQVTIREEAIVYKTATGKIRVHHVHSHAVLIGAAAGLGLAALEVGAQ